MKTRSTAYLLLNVAAVLLLVSVAGWRIAHRPFAGLLERGVIQEPVTLAPLKSVEVPLPENLGDFVKDREAAVALGKALFWDMQMGSDGIQACASCHFNAGADSRIVNQLRPAGPSSSDETFSFGGPNYTLQASDFPFSKATNEVTSSQGVFHTRFLGIFEGEVEDDVEHLADDVFNVGGIATRRVEPRNTPTVVNAVFFHRSFWDGRANNIFNGVDPFGRRSEDACVWFDNAGSLDCQAIELENAALASQAVGPVLSELEASAVDRGFADVGRKMLHLRPLSKQIIDPDDSVLGPLSRYDPATGKHKGLRMTYKDMIEDAFHDHLHGDAVATGTYTQTEANFSLFWGLSIMLYEATLVSDETPFDRYAEGDENALTERQKRGLEVFLTTGKCINCHGGPEFSNAASHLQAEDQEEGLVERMIMGSGSTGLYDNGFYNIGVTATAEDLGVGGKDPWGNPLSFSRQYRDLILKGHNAPDPFQVDPCTFEVPVDPNDCSVHPNPNHDTVADDGAFKTPGLRNVELTGPYFHNGGQATLMQVVEFYDRGGDFRHENHHDLDADIQPLGLSQDDKEALVDFMLALTDERVRFRKAPFDHPQLIIPNGHTGDHTSVVEGPHAAGHAQDEFIEIAAVGRSGGDPLAHFTELLGLDHFDGLLPGGAADLKLTKTASTDAPHVGEELVYTLEVTNDGPAPATGIIVDELLPRGVTLVSSSGHGSFAYGQWDLRAEAPLAAGSSYRTEIRVRVLAAGQIVNTARIAYARESDPDESNNTAEAVIEARFSPFWTNANREAGTITALLFAPQGAGKNGADGVVFAGAGEGGLHRSLDGGTNWFPTALTTGAYTRALAFDAATGALYVGTYGQGVYASLDGGVTFYEASGEDHDELSNRRVLSLVTNGHHPDGSHGADLFAGTDLGGVFKSKNGGEDWEEFSGDDPGELLGNKVVRSLAIRPSSSSGGDWLFAGTHGGGVYRTRTGDDEWEAASAGLENLIVHTLLVVGSDLYAGTNDGVFKTSTSGALSWSREAGTEGLVVRSLALTGSGALLAGTDGRHVWQRTGSAWTELNVGLQDRTVLSLLAFDQGSGEVLLAGTQDHGVHRSFDGGATWAQVSNVITNAQVQALTFSADGTRLYAGTYGFGVLTAEVGRSPVLSWTRVNKGLENPWIYALAQKTRSGREYLFAGTWGGGVYRTDNGGEQWRFSGLASRIVYDIAVGPTGTIYAATDRGEVARSVDDGLTWQEIGVAQTAVWSIGVDPRSGALWAGTFGSGIYRSVDGGLSWQRTALVDRHVFDFAFDTSTYPTTVYAATATGVVYTGNEGATWPELDAGLTVKDVRAITTTWPGGPLVAGTHGGGVFTYDRNANAWIRDGLPGMPVLAFAVQPGLTGDGGADGGADGAGAGSEGAGSVGEVFVSTSGAGLYRKQFGASVSPTSSEEARAELPEALELSQNYPNPFNPSTQIAFALPEASRVRLAVYDALGREVQVLFDGAAAAGRHEVRFEAGNLPSGVYFYRLHTASGVRSKSMILMK